MSSRGQQTMDQAVPFRANRFDRMQRAGAFGDLGTLMAQEATAAWVQGAAVP